MTIDLKSIFPGNSEMAQRMRTFDWDKNELGSPQAWPAALKTSVRILLTSRHPMSLWWGDQYINLHNDEYAHLLHTKHPDALGQSASVLWEEIWDSIIVPKIEFVIKEDHDTADETIPFINHHQGYPEVTYAPCSYSPILNDDGLLGGILCSVSEETRFIPFQRQMTLLRQLAAKSLDARNRKEAYALIADALHTDMEDIPFALIYELNVNSGVATLQVVTGISSETPATPKIISLDSDSIWPLKEVLLKSESVVVSELHMLSEHLTTEHKSYPINQAIALPFAHGVADRQGVLIIGLNPLRSVDDTYRDFLHLICAAVSSAIQLASAYETEKHRAETWTESNRAKTAFFSNVSAEAAQKLQQVSSRLIEENNIEVMCDQIMDTAMAIMSAEFSSIQILDAERDVLSLLAWKNFHPESAKHWQEVSFKTGTICGAALKHNERIIVPDVYNEEFLKNSDSLSYFRRSGITGVQSTPLTARDGRMLGMISTHWRERYEPSKYELALFDVLARQMADVLERQRAQEALKEADRRKDEFLAVLAHELRNPLFPVKNSIHLLQQTKDISNNVPLLQIMERQVNHMIRLVDDLLEISRITTGKIELHKELLNLADVINNALDVSKPFLDSKQQQVILSLPHKPIMVYADMVRMTQVFANLLNNAAKYTHEHGIINVTLSCDNDHIFISIKDNGIGISNDMLSKVFEMFTQEKRSANPHNRGLGIGLAMVSRLMDLHGGSVRALSAGPNYGSEFIVSLPLYKNRDEPEVHRIPPEIPSFATLRILIVDDNPDITDSFSMLLRHLEIDVQAVNNGEDALATLDEFNPHIIFLDIGMPNMNGYEVAEKIRHDSRYDAIKLVALTGWSQEKDRIKSKASGFDKHLAKPVDIDDLCDVIKVLMLPINDSCVIEC